MKLNSAVSLDYICNLIKADFESKSKSDVTGINEIHKVETGDLTFVDHPKYYNVALESAATFIIINEKKECPAGKALIYSDDPFRDYNILTKHFRPFKPLNVTMSSSAMVGDGTQIQSGAIIGNHVKIGKDCLIHANVVLNDYTEIGDRVIIQPGTIVGSDAFYYKGRESGYEKMLSVGRVIIHDDVEIGANCTIDRGVSGDTIIGRNTKIDNLVHIAHGVVIGEQCLFAAQVGIAGKTTIGNRVILWGQVGVNKDLTIGDDTIVYAQSGVAKSLEGGKTYFGSPVQEAREKMKEMAMIKNLPELWTKLKNR